MAVYVGMLRVARLCSQSPRVLGARVGLSRVWQEARLWGVRPLRYAALEERDGSVPWEGVLGILQSLSGGRSRSGWEVLGCPTSAGWRTPRSRYPTPHLALRQQEMLAWPSRLVAAAGGCQAPCTDSGLWSGALGSPIGGLTDDQKRSL